MTISERIMYTYLRYSRKMHESNGTIIFNGSYVFYLTRIFEKEEQKF